MKVAAVDAQTDIETFVATHRTGWARPGPTLYENYYTGAVHARAPPEPPRHATPGGTAG